ncbi:MAG: hypothetical protein IT363_13240 [Methanoregulaceae archaeon]|nr:hypothetical protein [Methanoregulaceae archaeon]
MENAPKPYYPGFRDMNLAGAFALTALFFLVIWFAVISSRLLGLRKRRKDLAEAIDNGESGLRTAMDSALAEAAFITPKLQNHEVGPVIEVLSASGDTTQMTRAAQLRELDDAIGKLRRQLESANTEYARLVSPGPTGWVAKLWRLPAN